MESKKITPDSDDRKRAIGITLQKFISPVWLISCDLLSLRYDFLGDVSCLNYTWNDSDDYDSFNKVKTKSLEL